MHDFFTQYKYGLLVVGDKWEIRDLDASFERSWLFLRSKTYIWNVSLTRGATTKCRVSYDLGRHTLVQTI